MDIGDKSYSVNENEKEKICIDLSLEYNKDYLFSLKVTNSCGEGGLSDETKYCKGVRCTILEKSLVFTITFAILTITTIVMIARRAYIQQ